MFISDSFTGVAKPLVQLASVWASATILVLVTRRLLRLGIKRALLDRDKALDSARRLQRGEPLV